MKKNAYITLIFALALLITTSGCSSYAMAKDTTTTQITSAATTTTFEPTETAAVATTTPTPTPAILETVVTLPIPATYASLFDGTKIYSDGSRTVILKTLVKGDQVTITGTAGQYGVTAEGSFVNLHLMSVVVTVTPTPVETTAAPTDPTAATTKAPATTTKATTAATTKAPAATTKATTAAYTPNCDNIRSLIVSNLQSRGYWFPDAVSNGGGSASVTTNYYYSDDKFAAGFLQKFTNIDKLGIGVVSVSVWIENGYVCFSDTECKYPTA